MFSRRSRELKKSGDRLSDGSSKNGYSGSSDGEKLDESTIRGVEASLREALTLNNEEARALLGRIEYQKHNFQAALQIFEGIEPGGILPRLRLTKPSKRRTKRGKPPNDPNLSSSVILLESVYFRFKSLEQLGRLSEAAEVCQVLIESFDRTFPHGLPQHLKDTKIQEFFNKALEFLPEFFKGQGQYVEAISAYRRALVSHWEQDSRSLKDIQVGLVTLLLYGGVDAPVCPKGIHEGEFVPSNNVEEALLVLMSMTKKANETNSGWDPQLMEHLSFALATCGHFQALAQEYESVLPGFYSRTDRWYSLALCYLASKQRKAGLNLLQKILSTTEKPNDVFALLHAASLCSDQPLSSELAVSYGTRAVENATGAVGFMKGRAWQVLGLALIVKARRSCSGAERDQLLKEALHALHQAVKLERTDDEALFRLGLVYAEQGNLGVAVDSGKSYLELTGPSLRGWRFLALVLSAQQRHEEAEVVLDAALQETNRMEQGELLLTKAKLQGARSKHSEALESLKSLLSLVQGLPGSKMEVRELVVWQEMAAIYIDLSQWNDAERCLEKAKSLDRSCPRTWYEYGNLYMSQKRNGEALSAYNTAIACDFHHAESKVRVGELLYQLGDKSVPVARSYLNCALGSQPRNPSAWFHLGIIHEMEDRLEQAAECFETAFALDQSRPVESFATLDQ